LRRSIELEADADAADAGNAQLRRRSRLPGPSMGRLQDIVRRAAWLPFALPARVLEQARRILGRRAGVLFYALSIAILGLLLGWLIGFLLKQL
jgi:hypothetical protein